MWQKVRHFLQGQFCQKKIGYYEKNQDFSRAKLSESGDYWAKNIEY